MAEWNPIANELFLQAAEFATTAERSRFLDEQCAGDDALRAQVESLLATSAKIGSFLNHPAAAEAVTLAPAASTQPPSAAEASGTRIGPYKLLQPIGEGGMGIVYMAEQEKPVRRRVALKIIKPGMDSSMVVARFEAERQALAMMDHSFMRLSGMNGL
jgi:eukaryotic-like serine/threonine-protein kinase